MKNQKWFLHFINYLKNFEEEYNQSRSELSPVAYALKVGKIPSHEYIKWAQRVYNLPYVQDEYFKTQLPPAQNWKDWKTEYKWSSEITPLGIWDGHLLVACLEIPLQFPVSLYPVFVLADINNIEKTYHYYINAEKGSFQAREKINEPLPVKSDIVLLDTIEENNDSLVLSEEIPTSSENNNEILSPSEQPEGLFQDASFSQAKIVDFDAKKESSLTLKEPSVSIKTKTEIDISQNTTLNIPEKVQANLNKGMPFLISLKKDYTQYFENFTQEIFNKNKNVYEKMIIFSIDSSESFTVPVSWTDTVSPRNKNIESIPLNEPSIFKIVSSTIKSYHGYVVLNEINEKFFDFWNIGQVPGNITMCPIIVKNKVVGFFMGLGEPSSYNWNTLKKMESLTSEITNFFTDFFENAKAS